MTDVPATVGSGFRTAAGFIAVIAILFYIAERDLSRPEAKMSLRWALILEGVYFLSLIACMHTVFDGKNIPKERLIRRKAEQMRLPLYFP